MNRRERRVAAKKAKARPIPEPIMIALRKQFPRVLAGEMQGDDVYLLMGDDEGKPHEAVQSRASPDFMTAIRACESGIENFEKLCGDPGFEMALLAPGKSGASALAEDHLLMEFNGVFVLEDGTRRPVSLPVTVGDTRRYAANPNPCQCANCQRVYPTAVKMLGLQGDFLAGRITKKQMEREFRQMGYRRAEKIQHH